MGKASKKSSKVDPAPAVAPPAKSLTKAKREAEEAITKPNVKKQKVDKKLEQVLLNEKSKVKSPKKKEATQKDNTAAAAHPKQKALIKKNTVVSKKVKPSSSSGSSSSSESDSDEDSIPKPVVASKPLHAGSKNGPVSVSGNGGKTNESSDSSSSSESDSEEETPVKGPASKKLTSISKKDAVSSDTDSSSSSGSDSDVKVSKSKKATPLSSKKATPLSSKKATPLSSTASKSQLAVPLKKAQSSDSSESESDSDDDIATVPPSKPSKKAEAAIRSGSSSSSESDSDEDVAVKAALSRPSKAVMNNGTVGSEKTEPTGSSDSSSSSESDSDEDAIAKPAVSTKPSHAAGAKIGTVSSAKKVKPSSSSDSSSSSESDSEGEPPVKAVPASNRQSTLSKKVVSASKVAESTDSSSSSESDSDEEEKLPNNSPGTVIKSKPSLPKTKQESSDETDTDSSDDDAYKPALDKGTVPAAKHQQSFDDEDSDNSDSDSSEESDEEPQRKKPKQNSDAKMLDAVTPKIDSKPIQSKSGKKDLTTSITPQSQSAGSKTLFAGNLNFDTEKGDLENFFKSAGEILDIRPASHPDGSFRGFAHVEFATVEAAQKAAEALDGKTLLGRSVHLNFARERGERGSATPYSSQREGDQKPTVFVRGFDRSLGDDEIKDALKEHFGGCGVISRISIPLHQDSGAIKGIAYIDVGDASQLNKALELNGSELGGYPLVVEEAMPRGGGGDSYGRGRGGRSGGGRSSGRGDFGHRSGGRDGGGRFGGRDGGGRFGGRRGFGGRGGGGRGNLNRQSAGTPSAGKKTTFGD